VIFVDASIPMYLVGAEHPHKIDAQRHVERLISLQHPLVTSAEVFQEILHRYTYLNRRDGIEPAFTALRSIVDEVLALEERDVLGAKALVQAYPGLSSRGAAHAAVMQRRGIWEIFSFDQGFDRLPGILRVGAGERSG
jgi:predicted nucleic acid-binding protein